MAVLSSTFWRINPGRTAEFMRAGSEAKSIHQRLGADVTAVQWNTAGSLTQTVTYGMLFPDLPTWGRFSDSAGEDPEFQAWAAKYLGPDTPGTIISQTLATDQPGFDQPEALAPGSFILAITGQLAPGHSAADVLSLLGEVKPVAAEAGAQMRVLRVGAGGENSLRFTTLFGFANAAAYAGWQVKYLSDPRGQSLNERVFGTTSPLAGQAIMYGRVLPL